MYLTNIIFPPELEEKIKKICEDIKITSEKKGEKFDYKFEGTKLVIEGKDQKQSYCRGKWFKFAAIYSEDEDENRRLRRKVHFEVIKS